VRILFIHQNFPGQFQQLAGALASDPANEVLFVTKRTDRRMPGVKILAYKPHRAASAQTHFYVRRFEDAVIHGQAVAGVLQSLKGQNWRPDVVIGHPGWGELLFAKDIFPDAPLLNYCEYFYENAETDLDPETLEPLVIDARLHRRIDNSRLLLPLEAADRGLSPTEWQKSRHPAHYQPKIEVIHDGVDARNIRPDADATFELPDGGVLTAADEVITYTVRGLEPYRGFPQLMRALPAVLKARPKAVVIIAGEDRICYGAQRRDGRTWRQAMAEEIALDPARVRFVDWLARPSYIRLLQVCRVHLHLCVPFVLSWSALEAMSAGCTVVASDNAPVREVMRHGETALLVDHHDAEALAQSIIEAATLERAPELRAAARAEIERAYALDVCLPRQLKLVRELAGAA
jgi:glycosyltransferase involved in cell wall biosynthesis